VAKIELTVFWVVALCSVVVEYQCFKGPCCLHLQGSARWSSEIFVSNDDTPWCNNPENHDFYVPSGAEAI